MRFANAKDHPFDAKSSQRVVCGRSDGPMLTSKTPYELMLAQARALVPVLAQRSAQTAALRSVSVETIADFKRAGFYRVLQPKRYGGLQMDFSVFAQLVRELAHGCASSAWVYAVTAELGWVIALFPEAGQEEV